MYKNFCLGLEKYKSFDVLWWLSLYGVSSREAWREHSDFSKEDNIRSPLWLPSCLTCEFTNNKNPLFPSQTPSHCEYICPEVGICFGPAQNVAHREPSMWIFCLAECNLNYLELWLFLLSQSRSKWVAFSMAQPKPLWLALVDGLNKDASLGSYSPPWYIQI